VIMVKYTSPSNTAISDTKPAESDGKVWVDTSEDPPEMKLYDSATGAFIPASGKETIVSQTEPTPEVGKIWFEPGPNGISVYKGLPAEWQFLKFLSAISGNLVLDDFADNKLTNRDGASTVANEFNREAANFRPEWSVDTGGGSPIADNSTYTFTYDGSNDGDFGGIILDTNYSDSDFSEEKVNLTMHDYDPKGSADGNNNNRMVIAPSSNIDSELDNDSVYFSHNKNQSRWRLSTYVNGTRHRNNVSAASTPQDITVQLDYTVSPAKARLFYASTEIASEPNVPALNDIYIAFGGADSGDASGLSGFHLETSAVEMRNPTFE